MNPFAQLISMLLDIYVSVILLRFFLQYFQADYYNPLSQFVIKATDPLVKPLRRLIPGFGGIDLSTIVLAWLTIIAKLILIQLLSGQLSLSNYLGLVLFSLLEVISAAIGLYIFLTLIRIIISWISPGGYNPVFLVISQLTEPFLTKFRAALPPMGGFDLSPMLFLILLFFINSSISYYLYPLLF